MHFIHLIARLYNFSRTNVAAIKLTELTVSFLNRFHRRTVTLDYRDIRMLCDEYFRDWTVHRCWPELFVGGKKNNTKSIQANAT